uniref:Uncharacterized protein n=1 Tax=Romanomermis culicivorax TaxID=13658 RepID=A0A915I495_ROMCU
MQRRRIKCCIPPPAKFVSLQPQPLEQPLQPPLRRELLLEQLIQRYDRDYEEQKFRQHSEETLPNNRQQSPRLQSQTPEQYPNHFDRSASQDHSRIAQPTGLWCKAHKSRTHNIEDCIWLKQQNPQQITQQEPNCPTYTPHSGQTDFRTNSNNIRGQPDWRPHRGAPPQRGANYSRGARNYFHEGNFVQRPNDLVQNTYAIYPCAVWEVEERFN